MNQGDNRTQTAPSAAACADAAAWIARLHGEDRTSSVETGFRRWLAASAEHRAAFEMANEIWLRAEHLPKSPSRDELKPRHRGLVIPRPWAVAATVLGAVLVIAISIAVRSFDPGLATRVGEQRTLTLEDGSRISLNTASRVHVHYDRAARRVDLDQGEAYFEVAKHPQWPFIVTAAGRQVVARGTVFLVRRDDASVSVTLVEGKVTVAPAA